MTGDQKWQRKLAQAEQDDSWGVPNVCPHGGADEAGTPVAHQRHLRAGYGRLVGGTDEDSLEIWAEGAARVRGLPEGVGSTRAELVEAYNYCTLCCAAQGVAAKGRRGSGSSTKLEFDP